MTVAYVLSDVMVLTLSWEKVARSWIGIGLLGKKRVTDPNHLGLFKFSARKVASKFCLAVY